MLSCIPRKKHCISTFLAPWQRVEDATLRIKVNFSAMWNRQSTGKSDQVRRVLLNAGRSCQFVSGYRKLSGGGRGKERVVGVGERGGRGGGGGGGEGQGGISRSKIYYPSFSEATLREGDFILVKIPIS